VGRARTKGAGGIWKNWDRIETAKTAFKNGETTYAGKEKKSKAPEINGVSHRKMEKFRAKQRQMKSFNQEKSGFSEEG